MSFMVWKWCRMKNWMILVNNIKAVWNLVYIVKMLIMSSYALLTLICWWSICFCENLRQPHCKSHRKFSVLSWEGILICFNLFYHPAFEKLCSVDGAVCYHCAGMSISLNWHLYLCMMENLRWLLGSKKWPRRIVDGNSCSALI